MKALQVYALPVHYGEIRTRYTYTAQDVDDLMGRVRAALAAERGLVDRLVDYLGEMGNVGEPNHLVRERDQHRAALDALLAE